MHAHHAHKHHLAGFTLIEVLVTMIVLSVGLLGTAALQITGIRSATGATSRTQATLLADDIVERMRANVTAVDTPNAFAAVDSAAIDCTALPNPYCAEHNDGSGTVAAQTCTTTEMAAYDINVWFCGINSGGTRRGGVVNSLPAATASITCVDKDTSDTDVCTNRSSHNITIGWTENRPEEDSAGTSTITQSISLTIQL